MTEVGTAIKNVHDQLDALREQIAGLRAERSEVEAAPIPLTDAKKCLNAWIDVRASRYRENNLLGQFALRSGPGQNAVLPSGVDATDLLCFIAGDLLKKQLGSLIVDHLFGDPLTDKERGDRLAEIDKTLLELERAEEALIRRFEDYGFTIYRRSDASPLAVLY